MEIEKEVGVIENFRDYKCFLECSCKYLDLSEIVRIFTDFSDRYETLYISTLYILKALAVLCLAGIEQSQYTYIKFSELNLAGIQ